MGKITYCDGYGEGCERNTTMTMKEAMCFLHWSKELTYRKSQFKHSDKFELVTSMYCRTCSARRANSVRPPLEPLR